MRWEAMAFPPSEKSCSSPYDGRSGTEIKGSKALGPSHRLESDLDAVPTSKSYYAPRLFAETLPTSHMRAHRRQDPAICQRQAAAAVELLP